MDSTYVTPTHTPESVGRGSDSAGEQAVWPACLSLAWKHSGKPLALP